MNKFTILFLTLFLALPMAMKADSAKEKKDDTRYLVGAVPEVDGIATNFAFCLSSGNPNGTTACSKVKSGYS